jgi:hypothetical protein
MRSPSRSEKDIPAADAAGVADTAERAAPVSTGGLAVDCNRDRDGIQLLLETSFRQCTIRILGDRLPECRITGEPIKDLLGDGAILRIDGRHSVPPYQGCRYLDDTSATDREQAGARLATGIAGTETAAVAVSCQNRIVPVELKQIVFEAG